MKTGRRDSKESYGNVVENFIPNHNDSILIALDRFQSAGIDTEGTVALYGTYYDALMNANDQIFHLF